MWCLEISFIKVPYKVFKLRSTCWAFSSSSFKIKCYLRQVFILYSREIHQTLVSKVFYFFSPPPKNQSYYFFLSIKKFWKNCISIENNVFLLLFFVIVVCFTKKKKKLLDFFLMLSIQSKVSSPFDSLSNIIILSFNFHLIFILNK